MARPTYAEALTTAQNDPIKLLAMLVAETDDDGNAFSGPAVVTGTLDGDATPAIAAAGDYADNDVVSNSATNGQGDYWIFAGMATADAGSGEIVGAILTTTATGVVATFRLWLFNAPPTASELDDNAAFSLHADDQAKLVQVVDFPACALLGGVAGSITAALEKPYVCAAADSRLYGILQITDAESNEVASMTMVVKLMVKRG